MGIKQFVASHMTDEMRNFYNNIRHPYSRDRLHCFGPLNPDKTFYVFRVEREACGVFTIIFENILMRLNWALEKGYIPVFDFQNYRSPLMEDNKSFNLWYRYFDKTENYYELSEVYQSRNVIVSQINSGRFSCNVNTLEGFEAYNNQRIRDLYNIYVKLSPEIQKVVNEKTIELFPKSEKKILAVAVRECYRYYKIKYNDRWHPKVFSFEEQCDLIDEYLEKWSCEYVFLMCDDREFLERNKAKYGEQLIHFEHPLAHYFLDGEIVLEKEEQASELNGNHGERMIDYLIEIELCSKCDCLLSAISSGAEAAIMRNDGRYENVKLIEQ